MSDKDLDEKTQEFGGKCSGEGEEMREQDEELGKGNEKNLRVENDIETMLQPTSSNKRTKEMSVDRLSELPDSVIIHILSFLGVKQAAITSVLSKRWQFLWSDLPMLEFCEGNGEYWDNSWDGEKISRFVSWVNRTLVVRTANYLERFEVRLQYRKCFASDVDVWVEYAVRNKVKIFILMLNCYKNFYMLPDMIYSASFLTCLWVRGCIMDPQKTIDWQSLTELSLTEVELNQHVIDEILSSCPVLYSLEIDACWGFNRLEINSRSLLSLKVEDCEDGDDEPLLEISAPYIHTLDISPYPEGRKLQIRNIPSLVKAYINFNGYGWEASSVEVMSNTKDLFENIQHAKELDLGRKCFEVVSMLGVSDWKLPQSTRVALEVSTSSEYKHILSGIICLLESSPNLETLVIEGYETRGDSFDLDPDAKDDLNCDLLNLKAVNITNITAPNGEPMLTLAGILLKRAPVLEKMVILTDVADIEDYIKIGQKLLAYPRSSSKAVVVLP